MTQEELNVLLAFFKALSDESRLKMVGLLSQREYGVGALAAILGLKEPTVSHHLARLKELDLVRMRADGNNRYYVLNRDTLDAMNKRLFSSEQIASWVPEIDGDEYAQKVFADYFENGRFKQLPSKLKKFLVILRWIAAKFEPGVQYTEKQVNEILKQYVDDYASVRRELIDFHYLCRDSGGGVYWVNEDRTD